MFWETWASAGAGAAFSAGLSFDSAAAGAAGLLSCARPGSPVEAIKTAQIDAPAIRRSLCEEKHFISLIMPRTGGWRRYFRGDRGVSRKITPLFLRMPPKTQNT